MMVADAGNVCALSANKHAATLAASRRGTGIFP
jgi:hypothetical protein